MYTCIQWPSGWPGGNLLNVITVTVLIHMTLGLVCTVVIHLYFRCLYVTAHVTALSVVVGGLVILHHCVKVRQALGLSHNCFRWLQVRNLECTILRHLPFLAHLMPFKTVGVGLYTSFYR